MIAAGQADGLIYAGGDPGVLFTSTDGGASFELHRGLFEHPTRPQWQPGGAGLCLHSIAPWPGDPQRLALGISAAGVWLTENGGGSWSQGNAGIVARYLPEEAREGATALCVHHLERTPLRPERLFMQFHGGVYRSDDAGESWIDIGAGLPSDFGFPLALDPGRPSPRGCRRSTRSREPAEQATSAGAAATREPPSLRRAASQAGRPAGRQRRRQPAIKGGRARSRTARRGHAPHRACPTASMRGAPSAVPPAPRAAAPGGRKHGVRRLGAAARIRLRSDLSIEP